MRKLLLFTLLLGACAPSQPQTPPPASGASWCDAAQKNLLTNITCMDARGDRIGSPNKHGVSFADICRSEYNNGVNLKAQCLASAKTCEEVNACAP